MTDWNCYGTPSLDIFDGGQRFTRFEGWPQANQHLQNQVVVSLQVIFIDLGAGSTQIRYVNVPSSGSKLDFDTTERMHVSHMWSEHIGQKNAITSCWMQRMSPPTAGLLWSRFQLHRLTSWSGKQPNIRSDHKHCVHLLHMHACIA